MKKTTAIGKWYDRYIGAWIPKYGVLSLISCFILNSLVYSGTQFLMRNAHHYDLTTKFDRQLPFAKGWIFVYLVCFLFWAINYILITREGREKWYRFAAADMMSRVICGIFFIAMPTTNIRPAVTGNDLASIVVRFVYSVDAPTNLFPSIHCLVSWFCFIGIRRSEKVPKWYKIFSCIFALLVCASTQFTKQHYICDVAGGIILAEVCYFITSHGKGYLKLQSVFCALTEKLLGGEYCYDE